MNKHELPINNFGNVVNAFHSIEIPSPLKHDLPVSGCFSGLIGRISSSRQRIRYHQRLELAVLLGSIRSEQK
jgi:hypothetical protein